ncbi:hypothetical protein KSX_55710 [Ktedonospora formicarum]|uniref:histidine kinase n=1 Tax=Ktedonospora formicarum TaxID=2778364 RepID=A0A8J3I5F0_9CHLR|nr:hypothetical protein KSX_55710 [Ktedonospora formicarum]
MVSHNPDQAARATHSDYGGLTLQFHEVRARARRQEMVPLSEQLYTDILETIADQLVILTPDGIVLAISQRLLEDAHLRREEVVGNPFTETPWWSYAPPVQQQLRAAIEQASRREIVHFETRIRPQEGWYLDLAVTMTPHLNADRQVEYLIYTGLDITARKRAEEGLRVLVDAIPQFVWMRRPDGSSEYANQRWRDYTNMTAEQAQGNGWLQAIHPDDQQRILEVWQSAVQAGGPYEAELRLRHGTTGGYRWFLARGVPFKDAQGTILKWFGTNTDIEEKKQAELQLKTSEQNFRTLAEMVPQLVWTMWPDGRLDYTNQRYRDVTLTNLTLEGDDIWRQFVHPEDIERTLALRHQLLRTGNIYENEYRLKDGRTGEYRWYLTRALPVRDETGQIIKWFGTGTDIDDQKRIEEALRQSREQANALMNSSIIGIFVGEKEQIVDANDTFLRMTGYTREDLREGRMNWMQMTSPEYLARTQQAEQELDAQQSLTPYEKEYVCKDGSRLPVLVGGVLLQHHSFQVITFVLDNSARKELEQRKDAFISMASHELRNPLTALKLQTSLLHQQLVKQSLQAPALSSMQTQINKLIRLVEDLLDVSKIQAGKLGYRQERVDLDALLHEVADTMQQIEATHTIVVRGATSCSLVGDKDRLGQVFTNLLSNAIKYSPHARTIEMDLSASDEAVTIRVQDHGLGIPREKRDKIFDRFYRVADPRQKAIPGLGVGLYIVSEIVKHHRGTITVESEPGKGSTFQVMLPQKRT